MHSFTKMKTEAIIYIEMTVIYVMVGNTNSLPVALMKFTSSLQYDGYYGSNRFDHTKLQCCLDTINKLVNRVVMINIILVDRSGGIPLSMLCCKGNMSQLGNCD